MTTTITVKANHGWPVDVTAHNPETGDKIDNYGGRVPAGETRDFIVTSSQDLSIHEVQPHEIESAQAEIETGEGEAA